jgi:hypothetical protein
VAHTMIEVVPSGQQQAWEVCRTLALLWHNPTIGSRQIHGLHTSSYLFSAMCDGSPPAGGEPSHRSVASGGEG